MILIVLADWQIYILIKPLLSFNRVTYDNPYAMPLEVPLIFRTFNGSAPACTHFHKDKRSTF